MTHLRPRTNTFQAVFRVRSLIAFAIHKFFMERGFVYRDDQNGRRYKQKYRLTPTGLTVAEDVNACIQEIQNAVSKNIPASDLDIFYKTLYKLCDNFAELIENRE